MKRQILSGILVTLIFVVTPCAVRGQSKLDPGMLPKGTAFYVAWHGTPFGDDVRKANSLLALWDDPDFAATRAAVFEATLPGSASSQKTKPAMTREELSEYASLLDNEFVMGYVDNPNAMKATVSAGGAKPHAWNGLFLVYDREGKETTIAKLLLRARTNEKSPPKISTTTIAGIPVTKAEGATSTTYWAEEGKYAIIASEPKIFEQIVGWTKRSTNEAEVLEKTGAYHEARSLLQGGVLEFFVHFPSIEKSDWDTSAGGFRLRPLLQSLKLEAVHVIAGRVVLEGARTRMQGAILGDVKPGTLFDLWDEGTSTPGVLAIHQFQYCFLSGVAHQFSGNLWTDQARFGGYGRRWAKKPHGHDGDGGGDTTGYAGADSFGAVQRRVRFSTDKYNAGPAQAGLHGRNSE